MSEDREYEKMLEERIETLEEELSMARAALGFADETIPEAQVSTYVTPITAFGEAVEFHKQYDIFKASYKKFVINCYKTFDKLQVKLADTFGDPEKL